MNYDEIEVQLKLAGMYAKSSMEKIQWLTLMVCLLQASRPSYLWRTFGCNGADVFKIHVFKRDLEIPFGILGECLYEFQIPL